jgi:RHS repeat-associated protein
VAGLGGPAPYWTSYTYTSSGQRRTEKQNTATPVTTTSCYNDTTRPHALTATTTGASCTGVAAQYTYDDTGNTEKRVEKAGSTTSQSLTWNTEGKLAAVTEGTTSTGYVYDADGELLIRRDSSASGETVLHLGSTEVHLKAGQKWANRYYSAAGTVLALRTNQSGTEKLSFLAADHHGTGSVAVTGDATQALTKRHSTPFGAGRGATTGVWPDDKGFLGKSADASTGLTHVGARAYDPTTGQFISVDPVLQVELPQTLNGYSYAAQNPVTRSDPSGLALLCGGKDEPACPDDGDPMPEPATHDGNGITLGQPEKVHKDSAGNYCDSACVQAIYLQQSRQAVEILGDVYADILHFMFQEMMTNVKGDEVKGMFCHNNYERCQTLNMFGNSAQRSAAMLRSLIFGLPFGSQDEQAAKGAALGQFGWLVRSGGEWDHKPVLAEKFGVGATGYRTDILKNGQGGRILYDVWSNIHYGYVGRAAGFNRATLIVGSHGPGAAFGATDEGGGDDISIDVGIRLYDEYGADMTEMDLHRAIVDAIPQWQGVGGGDDWGRKVMP